MSPLPSALNSTAAAQLPHAAAAGRRTRACRRSPCAQAAVAVIERTSAGAPSETRAGMLALAAEESRAALARHFNAQAVTHAPSSSSAFSSRTTFDAAAAAASALSSREARRAAAAGLVFGVGASTSTDADCSILHSLFHPPWRPQEARRALRAGGLTTGGASATLNELPSHLLWVAAFQDAQRPAEPEAQAPSGWRGWVAALWRYQGL